MIIVICGPTAVGKTKLSVELAKHYNTFICNADSTQVYRELNIGTAKVTEEEKCGIEHKLFDFVDPQDMYTVYDYQKDMRNILNSNKNKNIIMVGGTGLYIKAALFDYEFSENEDPQELFIDKTNEELYEMVKKIDPESEIHVNNRKRLIRRLNMKESSHKGNNLIYDDVVFIGLTTNREKLYDRINQRTDQMFKEGLVDEVKNLYDRGIRSKAVMTAIGYKELYSYFDGEITLDEAIELIKKKSRQYAKRQYTWFNNQMDVKWFNVDFENFDNTINEVIKYLESK